MLNDVVQLVCLKDTTSHSHLTCRPQVKCLQSQFHVEDQGSRGHQLERSNRPSRLGCNLHSLKDIKNHPKIYLHTGYLSRLGSM